MDQSEALKSELLVAGAEAIGYRIGTGLLALYPSVGEATKASDATYYVALPTFYPRLERPVDRSQSRASDSLAADEKIVITGNKFL